MDRSVAIYTKGDVDSEEVGAIAEKVLKAL
jgi:hypothetical protein